MNNIPRNEHPRPDRHRDSWLCLNGTWDFEIDNALVGKAKKFYERDSLDAKITVPFCPEKLGSALFCIQQGLCGNAQQYAYFNRRDYWQR